MNGQALDEAALENLSFSHTFPSLPHARRTHVSFPLIVDGYNPAFHSYLCQEEEVPIQKRPSCSFNASLHHLSSAHSHFQSNSISLTLGPALPASVPSSGSPDCSHFTTSNSILLSPYTTSSENLPSFSVSMCAPHWTVSTALPSPSAIHGQARVITTTMSNSAHCHKLHFRQPFSLVWLHRRLLHSRISYFLRQNSFPHHLRQFPSSSFTDFVSASFRETQHKSSHILQQIAQTFNPSFPPPHGLSYSVRSIFRTPVSYFYFVHTN